VRLPMLSAMDVAAALSRPRARFTWLLVVVLVGACALGGFFLYRHGTATAVRHRADGAQQQLTSYQAPLGFTDIPRTAGCFGAAGERCFTSVLSPEAAAQQLASSFGSPASSTTTCKVSSGILKICSVRGVLGSTRVLAIVSDRRLFGPDTSTTPATGTVASTVELALVTS
jgi:hypothetical protein